MTSKLTKLFRSSRESSPFMTNLKFYFLNFSALKTKQILITISFFDYLQKLIPLLQKNNYLLDLIPLIIWEVCFCSFI